MRKHRLPVRRIRTCSLEHWMKALLDPRCELRLLVCRYFNRKGVFGAQSRVLNEHMVTLVEHGVLLAQVNGQELRIPAGSALWMPPGVSQQYCGAAGAAGVRQYNLRFQLNAPRGQLAFRRDPLLIKNAWEAQPLLQMIGALAEASGEAAFLGLRLRGLIVNLTAALLTQSSAQPNEETPQAGRPHHKLRPSQRQRLAQYIAAHSGRRITPAELADEVQLSPDYFARVFRATYGQPPRTWLKAERMRLAAIRVRESDSGIKQVAAEFGFHELVLFYRQFRDVIGCTPGEYRRRDVQIPERG